MGTEVRPTAELVREFLSVGAKLSAEPAVSDALDRLYEAVAETTEEPEHALIALLTMVAATRGVTHAKPGLEANAEAFQISLLRSVYATHQLQSRVLH